jgi:hypothetical protein
LDTSSRTNEKLLQYRFDWLVHLPGDFASGSDIAAKFFGVAISGSVPNFDKNAYVPYHARSQFNIFGYFRTLDIDWIRDVALGQCRRDGDKHRGLSKISPWASADGHVR